MFHIETQLRRHSIKKMNIRHVLVIKTDLNLIIMIIRLLERRRFLWASMTSETSCFCSRKEPIRVQRFLCRSSDVNAPNMFYFSRKLTLFSQTLRLYCGIKEAGRSNYMMSSSSYQPISSLYELKQLCVHPIRNLKSCEPSLQELPTAGQVPENKDGSWKSFAHKTSPAGCVRVIKPE